jgi:hypothetical protein
MKVSTNTAYYTRFQFATTLNELSLNTLVEVLLSGFACVFKCEHNGRNTYTIHVTYESLRGIQNYPTKEKNILLYTHNYNAVQKL